MGAMDGMTPITNWRIRTMWQVDIIQVDIILIIQVDIILIIK